MYINAFLFLIPISVISENGNLVSYMAMILHLKPNAALPSIYIQDLKLNLKLSFCQK